MACKLFLTTTAALVSCAAAVREAMDLTEFTTDRSTPCSDLGKETSYGGAGGNAYVLRFKGKCGAVKEGSVAKAFLSEDEAKEAVDALARLPDVKALAGLVHDKKAQEFDGPCVHVHKDADCCSDWKESDTCHFMVMENGGAKTIEQCAEDDAKLADATLKGLVVSAIDAAQSIHALGWYHGDYQLKNIMVDGKCGPKSLKVVDLDGMDNQDGTAGQHWNKPHRMFRDYAMLLGSCDMGAWPLDEIQYKSAPAKAMAGKIAKAVEPIMGPWCSNAWERSAGDVVELGKKLKSAVEAA
jgi:hypothetical protein